VVSEVQEAGSEQDLLASQGKVDAIIGETLKCYDEGAIEEEDMAAFGLVLELFDHAVAERRAALQGRPRRKVFRPHPRLSAIGAPISIQKTRAKLPDDLP